MKTESETFLCKEKCPEEVGRMCYRYKSGRARLVLRPTNALTGAKYREPYSINESIDDCLLRQKLKQERKVVT